MAPGRVKVTSPRAYDFLDYLEVVHVFIRRSPSCRAALHQAGQAHRLTIRQLGYLRKNALKTWHREYEQRPDLPAGHERLPKYSQAQKERAVEHGRCIVATIKSLGYPSRALLSA